MAKSARDLEDYFCSKRCNLCLPADQRSEFNGVLVFPRKEKKVKVTDKTLVVCVLRHASSGTLCLLQRPETGLLANLFELPSMDVKDDAKTIQQKVKSYFHQELGDLPKHHGVVSHQFSHIHQKYVVWSATVDEQDVQAPDNYQKVQWIREDDMNQVAISTAMKKVFQYYKKNAPKTALANRSQPSIKKFFGKK